MIYNLQGKFDNNIIAKISAFKQKATVQEYIFNILNVTYILTHYAYPSAHHSQCWKGMKKTQKKGKRDEEYPRIRIWGFSFLVCCFTYVNLCISMFFVIHTYIDRHKYIYISVCV